MKHYLDTSVVLSRLLEGDRSLEGLENEGQVGSSRLMWTEVSRVLHRALQTGELDPIEATEARHNFARFAAGVSQIRITDEVLNRAGGSFPLPIRTLDAIHLSSAAAWLGDEDAAGLSLWSLDRQLNLCAAQFGYRTPLLGSSGG